MTGEEGSGEEGVKRESVASALSEPSEQLISSPIVLWRQEKRTGSTESEPKTVLKYCNGSTFNGTLEAGWRHKEGVLQWKDGTKYEGEFQGSAISGQGKYVWPDGSSYEGALTQGLRHGQGILRAAKGAKVYEGEWREGQRDGTGKAYNESEETIYTGEWQKNKRHGCGMMRYRAGCYEGQWREGKRHGQGMMQWYESMTVYEGQWEDDIQHGVGSQYWLEDAPQVSERAEWQRGNRYKGEFVQGKRQGLGTFWYSNGAVYEGEFEDNKKHGWGVYIDDGGHPTEGLFVEDVSPVHIQQLHSPQKKQNEVSVRPSLVLNLSDLSIPSSTVQLSKRDLGEIDTIVLRLITDLRTLYSRYASTTRSLPALGQPNDLSSQLKLKGLWNLMKDRSLLSAGVTLATVTDILIATRQAHAAVVKSLKQKRNADSVNKGERPPYDTTKDSLTADRTSIAATTQVTFREFCEVLVRVGLWQTGVYRPTYGKTSDQVVDLFKKVLLSDKADSLNHFRVQSYNSPRTQATLSHHHQTLLRLFELYSPQRGQGPSARALLKHLRPAINAISLAEALQLMGRAVTTADGVDTLDILPMELLFDDFEDFVVRVAAATQDSALTLDVQVENFISRNLLPLLVAP